MNDYGESRGPVTHLVVIVREGEPDVTEFHSIAEAEGFFEPAQVQWSEAYLTEVRAIGARRFPKLSDHASPCMWATCNCGNPKVPRA